MSNKPTKIIRIIIFMLVIFTLFCFHYEQIYGEYPPQVQMVINPINKDKHMKAVMDYNYIMTDAKNDYIAKINNVVNNYSQNDPDTRIQLIIQLKEANEQATLVFNATAIPDNIPRKQQKQLSIARDYYYKALDNSSEFEKIMQNVNTKEDISDDELQKLKNCIQEIQVCNAKATQVTNEVIKCFL